MEITEQQLDALKELGNIGTSHAADSLSQMLNSMVQITVPEVNLIDISNLSDYLSEGVGIFVVFEIQGEIAPGGYIALYLSKESAIRLTNTMLGMEEPDRELNEMDESAILEVGNIMVSQFLDATATLLGIVMIPSPPDLAIDMTHAIIESIITFVAPEDNTIILFATDLQCQQHAIKGSLMFMPVPATLSDIIQLLDNAMQGV